MTDFPVPLQVRSQGGWTESDRFSDVFLSDFDDPDAVFGGAIVEELVASGGVTSDLVLVPRLSSDSFYDSPVQGVTLILTVVKSAYIVAERLQLVSGVGASADHVGLSWGELPPGVFRKDLILGGPENMLGLPAGTPARDVLNGLQLIISAANISPKSPKYASVFNARLILHLGVGEQPSLLPPNATPQERAIEAATGRAPAVAVRSVWDPDTCPANVLPWLAWALSVDQWDPDWPEGQKRDVIRTAIAIQRQKGTAGAVRDALGALAIDARVVEWHRAQVPGAPYTYRLVIETGPDAPVTSLAAIERALATVDRVKSLRSHLDTVQVVACSTGGPRVGAAAVTGHEIVVAYGGQIV
ncbi:phage tail protein I [Roseovarius ramblicola]|uniref:Phage tail protein I n=1 Tax=Roseovarius ramblicola TaxID=2022336 RepID=A0ABV5HYL8_9RHOB